MILVVQVKKVTIWGNHSSTQFPDAANATVVLNGKESPVPEAVKDNAWLEGEFIKVRMVYRVRLLCTKDSVWKTERLSVYALSPINFCQSTNVYTNIT